MTFNLYFANSVLIFISYTSISTFQQTVNYAAIHLSIYIYIKDVRQCFMASSVPIVSPIDPLLISPL